jgi:hypothetical protein
MFQRALISILGLVLALAFTLGLTTRPAGAEQTSTASETTPPTGTGSLSGTVTDGTVTDATTGDPIGRIAVCAEQRIPTGPPLNLRIEERCVETNANGEYKISGLYAGVDRISFSAGYVCSLCTPVNYITQYFPDKPTWAEAEPITVTEGEEISAIDAQMVEGGQITGTVTEASGGPPTEAVEVCATGGNAVWIPSCAITNVNGEYTISALASGDYHVAFSYEGARICESECAQRYSIQYYNGKTSEAGAELVSVTAGSTTSDIDAHMAERLSGFVPSPSPTPIAPPPLLSPYRHQLSLSRPQKQNRCRIRSTCQGLPCKRVMRLQSGSGLWTRPDAPAG